MQRTQFMLSCAGGLLLVLAPALYAADTPGDMTASAPPESTAPADATAAAPANAIVAAPADATVAAPAEAAAASPPQVAAETPIDARATAEQQMATDPCAGASAPGSLDCEKLKRKVSNDKTANALSMAACTSHMDAKGNVIYDDPTCPSRVRPVVNDAGSVYLIRESPFFSLHIDKATEHARAAEIAGNQGQAIDLLDHAQMSLMQAKEAQRAGNVPGLNEGIISLTEALRLPEGSSVRDATAYVRDARQNLHQAAGTKYKEIQPQGMVAVSTEK
jgi:small metal-binding protein